MNKEIIKNCLNCRWEPSWDKNEHYKSLFKRIKKECFEQNNIKNVQLGRCQYQTPLTNPPNNISLIIPSIFLFFLKGFNELKINVMAVDGEEIIVFYNVEKLEICKYWKKKIE